MPMRRFKVVLVLLDLVVSQDVVRKEICVNVKELSGISQMIKSILLTRLN
jgi:hypothetical protein